MFYIQYKLLCHCIADFFVFVIVLWDLFTVGKGLVPGGAGSSKRGPHGHQCIVVAFIEYALLA